MSCERCPCPDVCLGWTTFCQWAARAPVDPVEIRAICDRSRLGLHPGTTPLPTPAEADAIIAQTQAAMAAYDPKKGGCCK